VNSAIAQLPGGSANPQGDPDPYGLGLKDSKRYLGDQPIQGAGEFFNDYQTTGADPSLGKKHGRALQGPTRVGHTQPRDMTANDAILAFQGMSGTELAQIQAKLYRAGYYSATFVPDYGKLRTEDMSAFRQFIIGLAASPNQGKIGDYLNSAASDGDAQGVNLKTRAPLVVKLTDPDELRATIQNTAYQLYHGHLPEEQVQHLIQSYQSMEANAQTAGYNAGDTASGSAPGLGGTVTAPPSPAAFAQEQIQQGHSSDIGKDEFVQNFQTVMGALTKSTTPLGG
jgi:hypothetical protein